MGIIGVLISALSIIPNNKGGSLLDELNPAVTTSPSGSDPDSVKSKIVMQYYGSGGPQDINYRWVFEPGSIISGDEPYHFYYAPGFAVFLEPNQLYKIEFDVSNISISDNTPAIYDPDEKEWKAAFEYSQVSAKNGSFIVKSDDKGWIQFCPCYQFDSVISDYDWYVDLQNEMISEGINIRIKDVIAAG